MCSVVFGLFKGEKMYEKYIEDARKKGSATIIIDKDLEVLIDFEDFNEIVFFGATRTKTFKAPKKLTSAWIEKKIELFANSDFKPISKIVKDKMDALGLNGFVVYATSYGIGISTLSKSLDELKKLVEQVKKLLLENGYSIRKEEFSDKHWVYRLKISTKNINK